MENVQQITQTEIFNLPGMFNGGNRERVENASEGFQQEVEKPHDNIAREVEQKKEDREREEIEVVEANRMISILNNKLQFVSDERSRTGLVVKILDRDSGDLIKQIPSEELLNIMARLKESLVGVIVDNNA